MLFNAGWSYAPNPLTYVPAITPESQRAYEAGLEPRKFTPRGFEDFIEFEDADGQKVVIRQSSARLGQVHLFCTRTSPVDLFSYRDEETRRYLLTVGSPILNPSQMRMLAYALIKAALALEGQ